jgi:hypothetical protein
MASTRAIARRSGKSERPAIAGYRYIPLLGKFRSVETVLDALSQRLISATGGAYSQHDEKAENDG